MIPQYVFACSRRLFAKDVLGTVSLVLDKKSGVDYSMLLITQLTVVQLSPIALKATEGREMKLLEAQNKCED